MYKIETTNGTVLGYVDSPHYIKTSSNGTFIQCPEQEALGVAYQCSAYHISGKPELKNAVGDVFLKYIDNGEVMDTIANLRQQIVDLQELVIDSSLVGVQGGNDEEAI